MAWNNIEKMIRNKCMARVSVMALFLFCVITVTAQIQVHLRVLPPYQSRIAEYASRPDLILLNITNTSASQQQIQLTGSLTGNNGIEVKVKGSYKSPSPIILAPGQTINLNTTDIGFLFDPASINIKGINVDGVVRDARLPEGNYQICIQALDYNTRKPLSAEAPSGCSMFFINDIEPPVIVAPFNDQQIPDVGGTQTFPITWNTPPGAAPGTEYHVKIVEIIGDKNPTDAIRSAIAPAFFERKVTGNNMLLYGPADPALTVGRSYAVVVQAFDPSGTSSFRNRGMSEVHRFVYGGQGNIILQPAMGKIPGIMEPACDCQSANVNNTNSKDIAVGNKATIGGGFEMTITQANKNNDGTFTGEGVVAMPVIGSVPGMKLRVVFDKFMVNSENRMFAGIIKGFVSANAPGFIPKADMPMLSEKPNTSQITELDSYLKSQPDKLISSLKNAVNSAGVELPFGIDKGPAVIAITSMIFTPTKAWFDASSSLDIPDAGPNQRLALAAKDICLDKNAFCKNGIMYLAEDCALNISSSKLTLLSKKNNNLQSGTYIEFDKDGFKKLGIDADYLFPANTLLNAETKQPLTVNMKATTEQGWGNWLATASMPKFMISGIADFKFSLADGKKVIYDHSDIAKADGMPANIDFGDNQSLNFSNDWHGFYIPELLVQMPEIVKNVNGTPIVATAKNLVFDNTGFSGAVNAANILALQDGSLDGWYFSIDDINMSFYKSSFSKGGMKGKLMLPVSGKYENASRGQIDYSCNLSSPSNSSGIEYKLSAVLKSDVDFKAWWAKAKIGGGSGILVSGGAGNAFTATANLNGSMEIVSEIKDLPDVALGHIEFTNMQFSTTGTTFSPGDFKMGIGSANNSSFNNMQDQEYLYAGINNNLMGGPNYAEQQEVATIAADNLFQTSLMGFNFTVKKVQPYTTDGNFGITFDTYMELVNNVNFVPKANLNFSLFAKLGDNRGSRKWWQSVGGKINAVQIDVNSDIAGLKIEGMIRYFNTQTQSGYNDRGFAGRLAVTLPVIETKIAMKGLFGSRKGNASSFQFFYIDALVDFGNKGIPMFPGTQLNGFAGGAYYNMQRTPQPDPFAVIKNDVKMPEEGDNKYATMESFSGVKYEPISGNVKSSVGFMAGVYFGLTSREILDAEISLSIGFANGSLNMMSLRGRGAFINTGSDFASRYKNAMGKAEVEVAVEFDEGRFKVFDMDQKIEFTYPVGRPILTGSGRVHLQINNNGKWFLKAGVPWNVNPDGPIKLKLAYPWISAEAQSYFQCGNSSIDNIPPVPEWIKNIINHGNENGKSEENSRLANQSAVEIPSSDDRSGEKGVITGASLEVKADIQYLIFYAKLRAGLGVDISLKNGVSCGNDQLGPRWYAKGQGFIGAEAALGVRVNIFGIKKSIPFLEAGLASVVEAGLPNPIYATGTLGGYFSVLDGLISKDFRIKFTIGDVCKTAGANPEELNLIETVYPEAGENSIFTRPAVTFNYPINNDFIVPLEYQNGDGESYTRYRLFRFSKEDVTISLIGGTQSFNTTQFAYYGNKYNMFSRGIEKNHYAINLGTDQAPLQPAQTYKMNVKAKVKMFDFMPGSYLPAAVEKQQLETVFKNKSTNGFSYVKKDNGSVYEDPRSIEFKTDNGPKNIPVDNVAEVLPYHRQQGLPVNAFGLVSNNTGYLQLAMPLTESSFNSTLSQKQTKIRFVMAEAGNVQVSEADVQIVDGGKKWQFALPPFAPNTSYVAKIYFKNTSPNVDNNAANDNTGLFTKKVFAFEDTLSAVVKGRQLTTKDALLMRNGDQELFAWYFKTGGQQTYQQKYNNMKLEKVLIGEKEINRNQPSINMQALDWSANEATKTINAGIKAEYSYSSTEAFNVLDIENNARSISLPQAVTANLASTVNKKEWTGMINRAGLDTWEYNIAESYEKSAWQNFVNEAFGQGRRLEIAFAQMAENTSNAQYGVQSIGPKKSVEYPVITKVMPANMFDVDFKNNNYGQSENATATNTATVPAQGAATSPSPALNVITNVNSGLISATTTTTTNLSSIMASYLQPVTVMKLIIKSSGGGSTGHGVVNQANNVLEAMRDRGGRGVNLGYPASLPGISSLGSSIDKVLNIYNTTSQNINPPSGLSGPSIHIAPVQIR